MLRIASRCADDVAVLELDGRIAPGDPQAEIAAAVKMTLQRGYRKLVLNLTAARTSDTSGISALLDAYLQARAVGAQLKLVNIERRFAQLLIVVALYTYFDVYTSEEAAVASFDSSPEAPIDTTSAPSIGVAGAALAA